MTKTVYLFDGIDRRFGGAFSAPVSPMEPGQYLIPTYSTEIEPPAELPEKTRHFIAGAWVYQAVPAAPAPGVPPTPGQLRRAQIFEELAAIDENSVRPARAVSVALATNAVPAVADVDRLVMMEAQAAALRAELATLNG